MKMTPDEIKEFWDTRAKEHGLAPSATTMDFYMRQIEINFLRDSIAKFAQGKPIEKIADVGCGTGYSTWQIAKSFPQIRFHGYDYAPSMIANAHKMQQESKGEGKNVTFEVFDITTQDLPSGFDLIYSDRCLINVPTWEAQQRAIKAIHDALKPGGIYIMIENFTLGHNNLNAIRKAFGLKELPLHKYSLYFDEEKLEQFFGGFFNILDHQNISSMYYVMTRVIYSKLCADKGQEPDYFDDHHKYAAQLPFSGNFGATSMYCLKKR